VTRSAVAAKTTESKQKRKKAFITIIDYTRPSQHSRREVDARLALCERAVIQAKVIIVFQFKKGFPGSGVQAALLLTLTSLLCACGEQPAPVESVPASRVAAVEPAKGDNADLPVIVVTASRTPNSET
jgi:hypothetical protein